MKKMILMLALGVFVIACSQKKDDAKPGEEVASGYHLYTFGLW